MSLFKKLFPLLLAPKLVGNAPRGFHGVTSSINDTFFGSKMNFLVPTVVNLQQSCGFKMKGRLRKRCKDCYFVMREERLFVICNTHRRHKQMSMVKDPKNTWILSHATQSKIRPW